MPLTATAKPLSASTSDSVCYQGVSQHPPEHTVQHAVLAVKCIYLYGGSQKKPKGSWGPAGLTGDLQSVQNAVVLPIHRLGVLSLIPDPLFSSQIFKDNLGFPRFFKAAPHLRP